MAEVDNSLIKRGFWINYSEGAILGATITTDQRVANIVIAVVAIVVTAGAGSAWNLVMFLWHQLRATSRPKDGLFRQQQVLFRTLATPTSVLADTCKLVWVWRRSGWSSIFRSLPILSLSFIFAIASLAASISSSYVVSTTDLQVLVDGSSCRAINISSYLNADALADAVPLETALYTSARSYADECYGSGSVPPRCHIYVRPRLEYTTKSGPCPFEGSICRLNDTASLIFDSGYLDSNDHFGLNSAPSDRVQIRRVTTYAPIDDSNYVQLHEADDGVLDNLPVAPYKWPGEQVWLWNFGARTPLQAWPGNGTYGLSTVDSNYTRTFRIQ